MAFAAGGCTSTGGLAGRRGVSDPEPPGTRPKRSMRARTVLRETPSWAAVCEIFQLVCSRVASRWSRTASLCEGSGGATWWPRLTGPGTVRITSREVKGRRQAELQHVCADGIPVGEKRHPLHDVRELANVPRPGIVQKPCFGVLGKPLGS